MTNDTSLATEKHLKIIDKPTHATAPDAVVHLDVDELKEDSLTYLPRHFSDLHTVVELKDTYDEKLAHYNDSDDEFDFAEKCYVIGGPFLTLGMCAGASFGIDALAEHISFLISAENSSSSMLLLLLLCKTCATMTPYELCRCCQKINDTQSPNTIN